jgi:hypothetical protein
VGGERADVLTFKQKFFGSFFQKRRCSRMSVVDALLEHERAPFVEAPAGVCQAQHAITAPLAAWRPPLNATPRNKEAQ